MVLSTGINKIRTAVFISGTGSNLKSLIKFSKTNKSPISIVLVISNNSEAKGLDYAKKNNIKKKVLNFGNKKLTENNLISILKKNNIQMICLAGFMKILSKNFLNKFKGKILNIHPSLLPKYKGLDTHKRVLNNKEKYSGCTVHFVNDRLDSGKIIMQKKVKISKKETETSLAKKILTQEHKLYPKAIVKLFSL
tara:strand:+ start:341 stop:922 length:582 start_codon:yes stop_codon:yes gene_type:complete